MFVPVWLIAAIVILIAILAVFALRRSDAVRGADMLEQQRRALPDAVPPPARAPELKPAPDHVLADPEVAMALAANKKIEAIKLVREKTGLGLKEAKELVERG